MFQLFNSKRMQSNKNQIIKHNSSISLKTTKKEIETSIFMNNDAVCYLSRSISQNLKTLRAKILEYKSIS